MRPESVCPEVVASVISRLVTRLATGLVAVTVRLLPASARPRFRQELLADLLTLPPRARLPFAVRVLLGAGAPREAIRTGSPAPAAHSDGAHPGLACRLHVSHRWTWVHAPGVPPYAACERCGRLAAATIFDPVA